METPAHVVPGEWIRAIRYASAPVWTQRVLADQVGVDSQTVSRWERARIDEAGEGGVKVRNYSAALVARGLPPGWEPPEDLLATLRRELDHADD